MANNADDALDVLVIVEVASLIGLDLGTVWVIPPVRPLTAKDRALLGILLQDPPQIRA